MHVAKINSPELGSLLDPLNYISPEITVSSLDPPDYFNNILMMNKSNQFFL